MRLITALAMIGSIAFAETNLTSLEDRLIVYQSSVSNRIELVHAHDYNHPLDASDFRLAKTKLFDQHDISGAQDILQRLEARLFSEDFSKSEDLLEQVRVLRSKADNAPNQIHNEDNMLIGYGERLNDAMMDTDRGTYLSSIEKLNGLIDDMRTAVVEFLSYDMTTMSIDAQRELELVKKKMAELQKIRDDFLVRASKYEIQLSDYKKNGFNLEVDRGPYPGSKIYSKLKDIEIDADQHWRYDDVSRGKANELQASVDYLLPILGTQILDFLNSSMDEINKSIYQNPNADRAYNELHMLEKQSEAFLRSELFSRVFTVYR